MPLEWTNTDVSKFLAANGDLKVEGGPIPTPQWFDRDIHTLADYIAKNYPPWGVIVRPREVLYRDTLVWKDDQGRVRIIDVNGEAIAEEVVKATYEEPDMPYLERLEARVRALAPSLPTVGEAVYGAIAVGVVALVVMSGRKG